MISPDCPFCEIVAYRAPANMFKVWTDAVAFTPLNPVVEGHLLVVPKLHVEDATEDPMVTAVVFARAAEIAMPACNLITSVGAAATQTVRHLHVHIVPREHGDGLPLPWTPQRETAAYG